MEIIRSSARSPVQLPKDYFTGTVRLDPVIDPHDGSDLLAGCSDAFALARKEPEADCSA